MERKTKQGYSVSKNVGWMIQNAWKNEKSVIWCIWHISTAGFAEQNGRNAKLNGRITFDY